jgi:cell division protein FtsX
MLRFSIVRYIVTSFFIALLIGLLHIFVLAAVKSQEVTTQVQNSLGLYLYLKDDVSDGSDMLKKITTFKE